MVVQPRDLSGLNQVSGNWALLSDEGVAPIYEALGKQRVPGRIAYQVGYVDLSPANFRGQVDTLAVVLPSSAIARKLLARTGEVDAFLTTGTAQLPPPSRTQGPNGADAALGAQVTTRALLAWRHGRLYGVVDVSGRDAPRLAVRLAALQEQRFQQALAGHRLAVDPQIQPPRLPGIRGRFTWPAVSTVPAGTQPKLVISKPGSYTLRDMGVTTPLRVAPSARTPGVGVPIQLDLPPVSSGRWLWRAHLHAVVRVARGATPGDLDLEPAIAHTAGPGADLAVVDDHRGRAVLVDLDRRRISRDELEVNARAMLGGSPDPRQLAMLWFAVANGAPAALASVEICPDSGIEVFSDPAKIGASAITRPPLRGGC